MLRASLEATAGSVIENAAADLAVQQRLQPLLALLLGGEQVQGLHVAGVRRRAVGDLGSDLQAPAGQLGQRRVLQVRQPRLGGQEQVPQPALLGQRLELLDDRRHRVVVGARLVAVAVVFLLGGEDELGHESGQPLVVVLRLGRHREVHASHDMTPLKGGNLGRASGVKT